jgi:SAM-dependent methyltransferase
MERLPHAILDRERRLAKGRKIAKIIGDQLSLEGAIILDVGTGGGYIAEYFGELAGPEGRVVGVDRTRQLADDSVVEFHQVTDARLPFEEATFDLIISNHVIEHVGDQDDQLQHLQELRRVVKKDGLIYVACPNRWTPFEPHFRLPLLCWMPKSASTFFVRLFGKGSVYDCELLTRPQLRALAKSAQLKPRDLTARALQIYGQNEIKGLTGRIVGSFPDWLAAVLAGLWFVPSLVFLLSRVPGEDDNKSGTNEKMASAK